MVDAQESFHEVNGCKTRLMRAGKGEPLLFLHGATGASLWLPFMARLAERFDLIVPEHPGFGRSDDPDWLDNIGDLAYFYLDFMAALKLDRLHLVGTSMGGWIAAEIAVRNTSRLKSLSLVAPAGIHVKGRQKGDIFMWNRERLMRNLVADPALAEAMLAKALPDDEQDRQMKNSFTVAKLAWHPRFYNPDLHKWLHRIDVPTQILWGDSDKVIPPAYGPAFQALIPNATLKVFERCGHLPHIEKVDDYVQSIASFAQGAA